MPANSIIATLSINSFLVGYFISQTSSYFEVTGLPITAKNQYLGLFQWAGHMIMAIPAAFAFGYITSYSRMLSLKITAIYTIIYTFLDLASITWYFHKINTEVSNIQFLIDFFLWFRCFSGISLGACEITTLACCNIMISEGTGL